jgi:NAD(P)-dependent dehydrogenase (short-subunit alcohol dehydrogenase family)
MLEYLGTRFTLCRVGAGRVANVALFLAADDLSFVNGVEIFADGGQAQV